MTARVALIMAGGTGGHVFPALALARELRARSWDVVWLGTRRGLESRLVPAEGIPLELLTVAGLRGKGALVWLGAPLRLTRALWQALGVLRSRRPAVVVGLGGFVSGPGGIAAWLLRRPLLIHEQNAVAGFTNRQLARFATRVLAAFPGAFAAGMHETVVGNPVRLEISAVPAPDERWSGRRGPVRVLIIGGSQGAARLNAVVPQALALLARDMALDVRHQSGERGLDATRAAYQNAGVVAEIKPFIDDMAAAYAWADLVVCRSGALTVSELAAAGLGAILVPFAAATDDHQTCNARILVNAQAALMIAESALTPEALAQALRSVAGDREVLLQMALRARQLAQPGATRLLADACESLALKVAA